MSTKTTTTKATKATTTTKDAPKMDAAAVAVAAGQLLKKYGSIGQIDGHRAALRAKFGGDWPAVLKGCKDLRRACIDAAEKAAAGRVFTFAGVLASVYKDLARDKDFRKLCDLAHAKGYTATDATAAARLVAAYYPATDATTGAPLVRSYYINKARTTIYAAFVARELTPAAAVGVLRAALAGLAKATKDAARKGKDTSTATRDNKRTPGALVGVYAATKDAATGTYSPGASLVVKDAKTAAEKAAAGLIGRPVPTDAAALVAVNSAARQDAAAAGAAALARERAAVATDAAAAGLSTSPAPRKPRKPATDATARAAAVAAIDATLKAHKAAAAAAEKAAPVLHA